MYVISRLSGKEAAIQTAKFFLLQWHTRITSYNVCYTKLLRAQVPSTALWPDWPFVGAIDPARAAAVRAERVARETAALRQALIRLRGELQMGEGAPGEEPAETRNNFV